MGHAVHFLERLERLSNGAHLDLALALYRDSALVRYILERVRLPDGADRVALALEERPNGPHIIVARDGGFVTCLAEDMSIGDRPVVSRAQITRFSEQVGDLRVATARMEEDSEAKQLLGRLGNSGKTLTREEFLALATLLPLIARDCMSIAIELVLHLKDFERGFRRSRYRKLDSKARDELRRYWEYTWSLGHLIALYGSRGRELAEIAGPRMLEKHDEIVFVMAQSAVRSMFFPVVLRGIWMAAHEGRKRVALFKQELVQAKTYLGIMMNGLPLMGIGLRHRATRAEVHKLLGRCKRKLGEPLPEWNDWERQRSHAVIGYAEQMFEHDDAAQIMHRTLGAHMAMRYGQALPAGHPLRFETIELVPEDVAFTLPCNEDAGDMFKSAEYPIVLLTAMPWVANASIEQLYAPAAVHEAYGMPWDPEPVRELLEGHNWYFCRDIPVRAQPKPGRNEACSCGSGKKYKRCCGAA